MKRFIVLLIASTLLFTSCATTRLPNGRKAHQGCQQGKQW
jgi:hypothetical protein